MSSQAPDYCFQSSSTMTILTTKKTTEIGGEGKMSENVASGIGKIGIGQIVEQQQKKREMRMAA